MRLRDDNYREAGFKRAVLLGAVPDPRKDEHHNYDPLYIRFLNDDAFEAAQPGDHWGGGVATCLDEQCILGAHRVDQDCLVREARSA